MVLCGLIKEHSIAVSTCVLLPLPISPTHGLLLTYHAYVCNAEIPVRHQGHLQLYSLYTRCTPAPLTCPFPHPWPGTYLSCLCV